MSLCCSNSSQRVLCGCIFFLPIGKVCGRAISFIVLLIDCSFAGDQLCWSLSKGIWKKHFQENKTRIEKSSSSSSSSRFTKPKMSGLNGKLKNGEDSTMKILRDLAHIPANRHCFDCGQRGPTYVNVTIGSFVCMTCSGLLRGLTPPQRVKSISMASFTPDEIELLKSRGNEYCRKVWLATCSAKDAHLGSDKDPDRMNLLKNFMSAKYEQKRFYVDPSKLPKGELSEIQSQTVRALSSAAAASSSSTMQKSPSLSSTRSSSSQQSSPSPILNNLRSNNQHSSQPSRLVNSVTLPDIKPLTSLIGPAVPTLTSHNPNKISGSEVAKVLNSSSGPNPVNFINNLSAGSLQNPSVAKINNNSSMLNVSPWGSESNGDQKDMNNFNSNDNFADFEDAFSQNKINGVSDLFAGQNPAQAPAAINGNGIGFPGMVTGSTMPPPMLPQSNSGGVSFQSANPPPPPSINQQFLSAGNGSEDKYAALKDLDSLFKQGANGDSVSGNGGPAVPTGLSNSASLPANLSSSASGHGWFSTSPNQNPFSQAPGPQAGVNNGWGASNGMNGSSAGGGANPHNPFFATGNGWKSSNQPSNNSPAGFPAAPSHVFSPVSSNTTNIGQQHQLFQNTISANAGGKAFNPFFAPTANPNNPFL